MLCLLIRPTPAVVAGLSAISWRAHHAHQIIPNTLAPALPSLYVISLAITVLHFVKFVAEITKHMLKEMGKDSEKKSSHQSNQELLGFHLLSKNALYILN